MVRAGAVALVGISLVIPGVEAQDPSRRTVTGVVVDTSGNALPYVNVLLGSNRLITSDSGRFSIRAPSRNAFKVMLLRIGYEPSEVTVPAGSDTTLRLAMTPVAVRLSAVQVLGVQMSSKLELRGYYDRMRDVERGINRGYFVTPEDIERRKPNFITQMFEGFPSIRVFVRGGGIQGAQILGTGGCRMTVYLDGVRIIGKLNPRGEEPVNLVVKPSEIAGAEIYPRGVGAPPQYQELNGSCGIVLIWTR
jgi:hypothetical protein